MARRVEELRTAVACLDSHDPLQLGDTSTHWDRTRRDIRRFVMTADPTHFLTWEPVMETMFVCFGRSTLAELKELRRSPEWARRWRPALREDRAGSPFPCPVYPASSANLIHHAFHVNLFEQCVEASIGSFSQVLEFGGGYGSFARVVRRLGFRGRYQIFDLPELCLVQRFYLESVAGAGSEPRRPPQEPSSLFSSETELGALALPPRDPSLFVALWSLSESPMAVRERFVPVISQFSHSFFAFQHVYDGIDNSVWFRELTSRIPGTSWTLRPVVKAERSWYLIGRPAEA